MRDNTWTIIILLLVATTASATIINVPADSSTIQGAINGATEGDTVLVAEGIYYENINFKGKAIKVASQFIIDSDTSHISKTIIDGSKPSNPDSASVVFMVSGEDSTTVLCGFSVTGGTGTVFKRGTYDLKGAGGILINHCGGKIVSNIITNNHVDSGNIWAGAAGIFAYLGINKYIVIKKNIIKYNSLVSNIGTQGTGLSLFIKTGGEILVENNTINNNTATSYGTWKSIGGGIAFWSLLPTLSEVIIRNNLISNNDLHCQASFGGGIYVVYEEQGGQVTDLNPCPEIYNNIICNNYSQDVGGGLAVWTIENYQSANSIINVQPMVINNTIVNNNASDGAGLFNYDSYPLIMNNIFWNDLSTEGSREFFNDDISYPIYSWDLINKGEIYAYYNDIQGGWDGESNISNEPLLTDMLNDDYHLSDASPCIGAGADSVEFNETWYYVPTTDFEGNIRPNPAGSYPDIGAYESPSASPVDIAEREGALPAEYALHQNYPNPFNPVSTIRYDLPQASEVFLIVYDILGREVARLVDSYMEPGYHQMQWNASELPSGIYIARLVTPEYSKVIKMVLLK